MTIILRDGFDTYNGIGANTGLQSKWNPFITSGGPSTLVAGRFGGQALQQSSFSSTFIATYRRALDSAASEFSVGFGFRRTNFGSAEHFLWLLSSGAYQVGLAFSQLAAIEVGRYTGINSRTILGSSANGVLQANVFHYIKFDCIISDTVGEIRITLDGDELFHLTGLDTRNGAPTTVNEIEIGAMRHTGTFAGQTTIDDLTVTDTFAGLNGERRVDTIYVNADGATLNFTQSTGATHFGVVDEAQVSTADYLSGSTVGQLDLLGLANLGSTPAFIDEVNVMAYAQKTDAATRAIALGVKSGATTSDGTNFNLAASFAKFERPIALDPNTGAPWTPAAVNALELQPKVTV